MSKFEIEAKRIFFMVDKIEKLYKNAYYNNNEVMRLDLEEILTALIKWKYAEKHIKEWEEEIQIQKYKEALGEQNK